MFAGGHIKRATTAALLVFGGALLIGLGPLATPSAAASADSGLAPTNGVLLGAIPAPEVDWTMAGQQAEVLELESQIGRTLPIHHYFYKFDVPFPTWREPWDIAAGRIPMISWARTSSAAINAGTHDAWIRARADAVKALGSPVLIRFSWEMDAPTVASTVGSPSVYVQAWRRIHGLFAERGATNVEWVWCPNAYNFTSGRAQQFYPGDEFVDWTCADTYNWSPLRPGGDGGGRWLSFSDTLGMRDFYDWAVQRGKPIMIGETGAQEGSAGQKAAWIAGMRESLKTEFPAVRSLVYFDAIGGSHQGGSFDWRVETSASSLQAFVDLAQDPWFTATPGGGGDVTPPGDVTAPGPPGAVVAMARGPYRVRISWTASADDVGVAGYDLYRDGVPVASLGAKTFGVDRRLAPSTTYSYTVVARDAAGNVSAPSHAATAVTGSVVLSDGFESGGLAGWQSAASVGVQSEMAASGAYAARATAAGAPAFAQHELSRPLSEVYFQVRFLISSQSGDSALLQVFRNTEGTPIVGVKSRGDGRLALYSYRTDTGFVGDGIVSRDTWHELEVHLVLAASRSAAQVWLDGAAVPGLDRSLTLFAKSVGIVQLGDERPGRSFDVALDDLVVDESNIPA